MLNNIFNKRKRKTEYKNNTDNVKCNHDVNDNNCTLELMPDLYFVYPPVYFMACQHCKEVLEIPKKDIKNIERFRRSNSNK